jgi:hypothetical protein
MTHYRKCTAHKTVLEEDMKNLTTIYAMHPLSYLCEEKNIYQYETAALGFIR